MRFIYIVNLLSAIQRLPIVKGVSVREEFSGIDQLFAFMREHSSIETLFVFVVNFGDFLLFVANFGDCLLFLFGVYDLCYCFIQFFLFDVSFLYGSFVITVYCCCYYWFFVSICCFSYCCLIYLFCFSFVVV